MSEVASSTPMDVEVGEDDLGDSASQITTTTTISILDLSFKADDDSVIKKHIHEFLTKTTAPQGWQLLTGDANPLPRSELNDYGVFVAPCRTQSSAPLQPYFGCLCSERCRYIVAKVSRMEGWTLTVTG